MAHKKESYLSGKFNADRKYQYTRLEAQVQNVKNSKVYVFGDDNIVDCEDDEVVEYEMDSLRPRKGRAEQSRKGGEESPSYVERRITEGETLLTLSLQYGCPVSELKRVNKLISDQDFFALTRVKIPVKQYSFLIDQIKEEDQKINNTKHLGKQQLNGAACYDSGDERVLGGDTDQETTTDLSDPETQKNVIREISINSSTRSQSREAREFLRTMDKDLSKIMSTKRKDRNSLDEVISVLTNKSVQPLIYNSASNPSEKSSEWSFRWRTMVILLIIVAIGAPLVFGLHLIFNGRNT